MLRVRAVFARACGLFICRIVLYSGHFMSLECFLRSCAHRMSWFMCAD